MKKPSVWTDSALLAAVLAGSAAALRSLELPFLWISGFWLLFFILRILRCTRERRWIWFNLAFSALLFGGLEGYASRPANLPNLRAITPRMSFPDDVLGYAPSPGVYRATKSFRGESIFDTRYTIGDDGLRVSPPTVGDLPCIAFFGGSFAFGDGIADHETLPYQVGLQVASELRTYNFGLSGYGPHQMLAALERGRVESTLDCELRHAIYVAVAPHASRVAEAQPWDPHGPRYALVDGELTYQGHFDDHPPPASSGWIRSLGSLILEQLWKSYFIRQFEPAPRADPILFGAIVAEASSLVEERFPTSEFHVILWDAFGDELETAVRAALTERRVFVRSVSDILPNFLSDLAEYQIGERDGHPNPHANRLMASYVVQEIIRR